MSNKYLAQKIEDDGRGAYINNLIFTPTEVQTMGGLESDAFKEFQELKPEQICEILDWNTEEETLSMVKSHCDDGEFLYLINRYDVFGFLAEVYFPVHDNFKFKKENDEYVNKTSSCSFHSGHSRIAWLYAESIGELTDKIIDKSNEIYDEQKNKEFKKLVENEK